MAASRLPHAKVTREDWLSAARDALVTEGVERVKVAVLAERLEVARSSFYWYFRDREQLLLALLEQWEGANTASIIERAGRPAVSVNEAILGVFECWADPSLFDARLEFAVRDWARRDQAVKDRLAAADARRLAALAALHRRFGCAPREAQVRARVQYHSQIGLFALGVDEPTDQRLELLADYVEVFSGVPPTDQELSLFVAFVRDLEGGLEGSRKQ